MLLACSLAATAQTTAYNPPPTDHAELAQYNKDYQNYKELYIKKLDSEIHYKILLQSQNFVEKMNHPEKLFALMYVNNDPLAYIKENLTSTDFESYEDAEAEWKALETAQIIDWQEKREYYDLRKKITKRWGIRMLADVGDEIALEFPEKFNLLDNN